MSRDAGVKLFGVRIDPNGPDDWFRVDVLRSPDGGDASAITELDIKDLLAQRKALESTSVA